MTKAEQSGTPRWQACRYRDGLVIAILAARPLRRRNLAGLTLGHSLIRQGSEWWIDIPEAETKTGAPIRHPLSQDLSTAVDHYLAVHRPVLAVRRGYWWQEPGAALWVSSHGSPMTEIALYDRIVRATRMILGRPNQSASVPGLRGDYTRDQRSRPRPHGRAAFSHKTFATTERFYNQAQTREAAQRWQDHVGIVRKRLARTGDGDP